MDPRFKEHAFVPKTNFGNAYSKIKDELKAMIFQAIASARDINLTTSSFSESATPQTSKYEFLNEVRKSSPNLSTTIPSTVQAIVHLTAYMEEPVSPDDNADVIKYWYQYTVCDALKNIALKYLVIPVTSVPSERVNSIAVNTISEKLSRLTPDMAEKLVFLRQNYKFILPSV